MVRLRTVAGQSRRQVAQTLGLSRAWVRKWWRRYRDGGYLRRPLRNLLCLSLYLGGVPPQRIARLYG